MPHKKKKTKTPTLDTGFPSKKAAEALGYIAGTIERLSDGAVLTLNSDHETYSFSKEFTKGGLSPKYTYERLMEDSRAKGAFVVRGWIKNFNAENFVKFLNKEEKNPE